MGLSRFEKWATVFQAITAVASIIIASVALSIAHSEKSANSYYRKIAHEPIIIFSYNDVAHDPDFDFIGYEIENRGPGYAIVAPMTILSPDGRFANTPDSIERFRRNKPKNLRFWRNHGVMVLKPGEKKKILWIEQTEFDPAKDAATVDFLRKTIMVLPYCSLTGTENIAFITGDSNCSIAKDMVIGIKADSTTFFTKYFEFRNEKRN